ncbi:MAG: general secretion pathway protein GspK [Cyanobacteria bacterium]|nr:general secretion pathway protein GspK [Cyanobacteria bacterium bin.51]
MAKGQWLDALARRLLVATGQLAPPAARSKNPASPKTPASAEGQACADGIERDLLSLKLAHDPALRLRNAHEVGQLAALGWNLDVNRATAADWLRLPGITPYQVDLLLRLQAGGVQLSGIDDLQRVLGLQPAEVLCWEPLLAFRWYGDIPRNGLLALDLNRASSAQLQAQLGLDPERGQRLVRERGRGPFQDLADLQQRLQLPADLVEGLIGKVSFGKGPLGPELPRRR